MLIKCKEKEYVYKILSCIEDDKIRERINNILLWDISKAEFYKKIFYIISMLIILINASIPVINQLSFWEFNILTTSIISTIASILTSILTLVCVKDNWYRYRKYSELIKRECILYINECEPYNGELRNKLFVKNIELISNDELSAWQEIRKTTDNNVKRDE